MTEEEQLWSAMKLSLADYVRKNGFSGVVLGLSGGIDSAVSAAAAVDALGAKQVHGILLPSPYNSKGSIEDALALAKNLGLDTTTISITPGMQTLEKVLSPVFKDAGWMEDVSIGGNVQSRLRGLTLMAMSNRFGWMLLSTANKSEIAVGYSTLYGDSCGSYNVLKDLYKTQIYALAEWYNREREIIPRRSITKPPSAELAPGQTDEDQLPPYKTLDAILLLHIEGRKSAREIIAKGYKKAVVEQVVRMVQKSEYKRRQSCPGVKLSPMQFGKDRRMPLTNRFDVEKL
jgi:NAD+ synthetase